MALASLSGAFVVRQQQYSPRLLRQHHQQQQFRPSYTLLLAKKTKKQQSRSDMDDVNRWYESVRSDATPDAVFWEEMDRQRLWNQIGPENRMDFVTDTGSSPYRGGGAATTAAAAAVASACASSPSCSCACASSVRVAAAESLSGTLAKGEGTCSSLRSGDPFAIESASEEAAVRR